MPRALPLVLLLFELGCGGPLPDPPAQADAGGDSSGPGASLSTEPEAELSAVPPVLRLLVRLPDARPPTPADVQLFHGQLSDYYLSRLARDDLPLTLLERRVPTVSWVTQPEPVLVVAPAIALLPGERYSVVWSEQGLLGLLSVREQHTWPQLARIWPPPDSGCGARYVVYCGAQLGLQEPVPVRLEPGGYRAILSPGVDEQARLASHCAHLRLLQEAPPGAVLMAPPAVGPVALDPAPLLTTACAAPPRASCDADRVALSVGCAEVQDDRLIVLGPSEPTLWIVGTAPPWLEVLPAGGRFAIRGLQPGAVQTLEVRVIDLAGNVETAAPQLRTTAVRPHVVINEVLANAIGPEPEREWVELYNDGVGEVQLDGWVLEDVGGVTALPPHVLQPGDYALLVNETFAVDAELDVPPAAGSAVLRVARLGRQGLANAGELLRLRSPDGVVRSRFLPVPQAEAGISVARVSPWCPDEDPGCLVYHAGAGASPGAPNQPP